MFEPRLHLLFRNKLHGFHLDDGRTELSSRPDPEFSSRKTVRGEVVAEVQPSLDNLPRSLSEISIDVGLTPKKPNERTFISHLGSLASSFSLLPPEMIFSTSAEELLQDKDHSKKKPAVYVAFATSHPLETDAVRKWLCDHISPRHIYTDAEKDGWAEWCEEIETRRGIVLFHDERPLYWDLKHLSRYLSSSASIACYNMSFADHDSGTTSCTISRLFPRGTAIFITETSMLEYPEASLYAMRWFEKSSREKVESWKLCLIPNPTEWIIRRAQESEGKDRQGCVSTVFAHDSGMLTRVQLLP